MKSVVFVAPYFLETTLGFVDAVSRLPGVRMGLVSVDGPDQLPAGLRSRLAAHVQVHDGLDPAQLRPAIEYLAHELDGLDRLVGTLEELQVPLGVLRDAFGLPGLGADAARNFRDKAHMKTVLSEHGLPCARHALAVDAESALALAHDIGFPLVIKPPAGAGARSTFRVGDEAQLRAAVRSMAPSADRPALLEEFLTGRESSFDSVCVDGRLAWFSVCHYFPTPLTVLENAWIQWCVLIPREAHDPRYAAIQEAAARALPVLGLRTGLSHMEWFEREDGSVAISEVGARPPGARFTRLISAAHDFDLDAAWAHLMVYDEFPAQPRPYAAGAVYLRGQGRGSVSRIRGLGEAQRELGSLAFEVRLPKVGQTPSGTYEGDGYVILRHPETDVVKRGLRRVLELIRIELA